MRTQMGATPGFTSGSPTANRTARSAAAAATNSTQFSGARRVSSSSPPSGPVTPPGHSAPNRANGANVTTDWIASSATYQRAHTARPMPDTYQNGSTKTATT